MTQWKSWQWIKIHTGTDNTKTLGCWPWCLRTQYSYLSVILFRFWGASAGSWWIWKPKTIRNSLKNLGGGLRKSSEKSRGSTHRDHSGPWVLCMRVHLGNGRSGALPLPKKMARSTELFWVAKPRVKVQGFCGCLWSQDSSQICL